MNARIRVRRDRAGLFCLSLFIALGLVIGLAHLLQPSTSQTNAAPVSIGLVPNVQTVNDMGFNWMAYQGLLRAQAELGITPIVYTTTIQDDYEPKLQQCAQEGNALCIGVGFFMGDAVYNTAQAYTSTLFAIVDYSYLTYTANLRGIWFASEEAAYLAGTLAGLLTFSDVIGDIGGMEIPVVTAFTEGYRNGAGCANPEATVLITYTNDFSNPEYGEQVAQQMIAQGADVVFAAAGQTGEGAILTTTQSSKLGIGVDTDYYQTVFNNGSVAGSNFLLTSVLKRVDNAVFLSIADVVAGTFSPGTMFYDLADGGVGLAPFHETEPMIPPQVKYQLERVQHGILTGVIDANSQDCPHYLFLPAVKK